MEKPTTVEISVLSEFRVVPWNVTIEGEVTAQMYRVLNMKGKESDEKWPLFATKDQAVAWLKLKMKGLGEIVDFNVDQRTTQFGI